MAFLQWADVEFMYAFQAPSSSLGKANAEIYALSDNITSFLGTAHLQSGADVSAQFLDTEAGYRTSYGRYYHCAENTNHVWTTWGNAGQKGEWEKASFTYGFAFRDTSTTNANRTLISKPTTTADGNVLGNNLSSHANGTFIWSCDEQASGSPEVVTIAASDYEKDVWYAGYVIKADGVQSKVGLKKKGTGSWITANSGARAITVDYDNAKNAALCGGINSTTGAVELPWLGDLQRFCMWNVALTESDVQGQLEDHFGIADPAVTDRIGSGGGRASMAENIEIVDVPIGVSIDPGVANPLRQLNANMQVIANHFRRDILTFDSTGGVETLAHRLGKKPTYLTVLNRTGTSTIYATTAQENLWTTKTIVLTTGAAGTKFTLEIE